MTDAPSPARIEQIRRVAKISSIVTFVLALGGLLAPNQLVAGIVGAVFVVGLVVTAITYGWVVVNDKPTG